MSRLATCIAALGLLAALGGPARAQEMIPGGWAPTFSYQSFGMGFGPNASSFGFAGGFANPGFGGPGFGGPGFGSGFGGAPVASGIPYAVPGALSMPAAPAMTTTAVDPLIQAIQKAPNRRRFRR